MSVDLYRVGLFKKKIRATVPEATGLRLYWSVDKQHLVIPIGYLYYQRTHEIGAFFSSRLTKHKIDHKILKDKYGLYRDRPEEERPIDCISIPIDQEALPERKRS